MAGHQNLPDAFAAADRSAGRPVDVRRSMDQALEFQLRSTDVLLNKILSGGQPASWRPRSWRARFPRRSQPGSTPPVVSTWADTRGGCTQAIPHRGIVTRIPIW